MTPDPLARQRPTGFTGALVVVSAGFYLLLCVVLWTGIRRANSGQFLYSIDDPYIHLALSEQIAHGHYGINAGEAASPSSSILWPLLLAPFSRFAWQPLLPLILNLLAGVATAVLLGLAAAQWPGWPAPREKLRRILSAVALVLIGNLAGLTFLGMEHTLQVLLAAACAWGIIAVLRGQRTPTWCLIATAIGPMLRYEAVGLVFALALALAGQHRRRAAAVLVAVSVAPLMAFSVFLRHLGLPLLPISVMVKANAVGVHNGFGHRALLMMKDVFLQCALEPHHRLLVELFLLLAVAAWREKTMPRRLALSGAAAAAGFHLLIGKFGWFYRYEVYIVLFSVMILLYVLHELPRLPIVLYSALLLSCSALYIIAVRDTVASSHDVYLQQYQMHHFVTQFYTGNVAVNDLGLVSYRRRPGTGVLDLVGLGSLESAQQQDKSSAWLDFVTREHNIGLVAIYPNWFETKPAAWTLLGELCETQPPITLGGNCVVYYATPLAPANIVQQEFQSFVKTLPPGIKVTLSNPERH